MEDKSDLLNRLHSEISPDLFEDLILNLLNEMGFKDCQVTKRSGDKGIDLTGTWENSIPGLSTDMDFIIQAKRHSPERTINPRYVRELRGALTEGQWGLLVTTSNATDNTKNEGLRDPRRQVSVIDGPKLIELIKKYEVGVSKNYEIDFSQLEKEETPKIEEEEKEKLGKKVSKKELLSRSLSQDFQRLGNSPIYESEDKKVLFRKSKYYDRPTINYWYGMTPTDLERVSEQGVSHFGFGCGSKGVVLIPVDTMKKEVKDNLNISTNSDNEIRHYHIQFSENEDDSVTWIKKEGSKEELKLHKYPS